MPKLKIFAIVSNALQIWDLSDPEGKGHLDRKGLFAACKLVALAQDRQDVMVCNLLNECPAPNFGDATAPGAPVAKAPEKAGPNVNFLVKPEEKRKYDTLFSQLQPADDKLPGDKVRLCSKLRGKKATKLKESHFQFPISY